ncbi:MULTISPECIES: hypothetical protein [unclassified Nocardia]|uniref:Rv2629 family ribosome hibernation factor n=1 Tax=unclassified Nocardia TaxID=2637762 RepID=UPI001CE3E62B|nr:MULTISPECIES: hypothetical protein [unclassified Nocardia]
MTAVDIRRVAEHEGPFVSVCFDDSHDTEDAARQQELRWRSIRDQLLARAAPARSMRALDEAIIEGPPAQGRSGRLLIADRTELLVDETLPRPPDRETIRVSALPYLLPLAERAARRVPHVLAVVDRIGADLHGVDADGAETSFAMHGREHPVHQVRQGGLAHWSIRHRTDETVRRNMIEIAREVARLADTVRAAVVIVAGEVAARAALRAELASLDRRFARDGGIVEITSGARAAGGDRSAFAEQVAEVLRRTANERGRATLERFAVELGHGMAVEGLPATTFALRTANVRRLLISGPALGDRIVRVGDGPTQLAGPALQALEDVENLGDASDLRRADEAVPVAALSIGADITPVDEQQAPADGVGALLRYQ